MYIYILNGRCLYIRRCNRVGSIYQVFPDIAVIVALNTRFVIDLSPSISLKTSLQETAVFAISSELSFTRIEFARIVGN